MNAIITRQEDITRKQNLERRNSLIRAEFKRRFTDQEKPKRYTREYIISQIALERCLSMGTVENVLYTKPKALTKTVQLTPQQPEELAAAA